MARCGPSWRRADQHPKPTSPTRRRPSALVDAAVAALGHLDVLVVNHAHSSDHGLGELDAEEIDRALIVNVRAPLLLVAGLPRRATTAATAAAWC